MDSLQCAETSRVHTDRLECPACKRDYLIREITHVCNELASCNAEKKSHKEEYHPSVVEMPSKRLATCVRCEESQKRRARPRNGTCPKCKYTGMYNYGADKLCPSCAVTAKYESASVTPSMPPSLNIVISGASTDCSVVTGSSRTISIRRQQCRIYFTVYVCENDDVPVDVNTCLHAHPSTHYISSIVARGVTPSWPQAEHGVNMLFNSDECGFRPEDGFQTWLNTVNEKYDTHFADTTSYAREWVR